MLLMMFLPLHWLLMSSEPNFPTHVSKEEDFIAYILYTNLILGSLSSYSCFHSHCIYLYCSDLKPNRKNIRTQKKISISSHPTPNQTCDFRTLTLFGIFLAIYNHSRLERPFTVELESMGTTYGLHFPSVISGQNSYLTTWL